MPDEGRLPLEPADHVTEVVGDLPDRLVGEDLGVPVGFIDGVGIVGPAGGKGDIACLLEDRPPAIPAAGQQPQTVDKHDRGEPRGVGLLDLGCLVIGNLHHDSFLPLARDTGALDRAVGLLPCS
jgi:hypothetical protein